MVQAQSDSAKTRQERSITAVFVEDGSITLDGELGEPAWKLGEPATDFIQSEPYSGQPASEKTEVRVLYDRKHLYVGAICHESEGRKGIVVNDMKRDFDSRESDVFQVVLDTFNDKRNAFVFSTNPKGALRDMQTGADGISFNGSWDAVWDVKTKVTDEGWQAEFSIPFRTLRFNRDETQSWGINFERRIRKNNERTYWAPIPQPYHVYRVSLAGSLEGVNGVRQGRNLYFKPYVSAPIMRREDDDVDFSPDAGFDLKYGITSGLTLDLTVNTDFSQVEADDAQINFTRFSVFFPEKREFFLENQEVFEFGNVGRRGITRRRRIGFARPNNDLIPFFSRRIGIAELEDDERVLLPILGGARVTGRAGNYRLGIISMQAGRYDEIPSTNFTVARVRRDVLQHSDLGVIFVNKYENGGYFNRTYGADANFRFFNYLDISSYVLNSETTGIQDKKMAGFLRVAWRDRLFDLQAYHISIDDNYNAEAGFVPRVGIQKSFGQFELTPRPEGRIPWVREFKPGIGLEYVAEQNGVLATKEVTGSFSVEFNDSGRFSLAHRSTFERLIEEDEVLDEVLPPGDYDFTQTQVGYSTDPSRFVNGSISWRGGEFYNGERDSYTLGLGLTPQPEFGVEVLWDHADISFPTRDFETELLSSRLTYAFNTRMFVSVLLQYSSEDGFIASNVRFRWIHKPLSDFFLVYNESRVPGGEVLDRALIAKLTYLFDF